MKERGKCRGKRISRRKSSGQNDVSSDPAFLASGVRLNSRKFPLSFTLHFHQLPDLPVLKLRTVIAFIVITAQATVTPTRPAFGTFGHIASRTTPETGACGGRIAGASFQPPKTKEKSLTASIRIDRISTLQGPKAPHPPEDVSEC